MAAAVPQSIRYRRRDPQRIDDPCRRDAASSAPWRQPEAVPGSGADPARWLGWWIGLTLAGGYKSFFFAGDVNVARADLGFDDRFKATVASARVGWNGEVDSQPLRAWVNVTYWDTFAVAKGSISDSDGGTLSFEADQGPKHPYTYGLGLSYSPRKWLDLAVDTGTDLHRGWYFAIAPVIRF